MKSFDEHFKGAKNHNQEDLKWLLACYYGTMMNLCNEYSYLGDEDLFGLIFLRKLLRFCLSRLAIGSQNRTASGENSRCNKKAHPAFRQDARKIACGYFQANGINMVHFAPKWPVFCNFIS